MNIPRKILSKVQQQRGRSDVGTQGICQGRHPGKLHKATLHYCTYIFRKRRKNTFFTKLFFVFENRVLLHVLRAILCYNQQQCTEFLGRMLYQYSVRGFHHPHQRALGTEIVPVQYLTLMVERRVFGALRMATPRGGRGVTIGPDTCHSDFIFVSSNFWNTHFLPLLH